MLTLSIRAIRRLGSCGAFARYRMNLFTGACMPLGFHPAAVERGEADGFIGRQEQIVTVLAASTGILVVAAIAVLMGMA